MFCKDTSLYAGYTVDLNRRLDEHNSGKGAKYTFPTSRRPVKMLYSEIHNNRSRAMKAEAKFKQLTRSEKEIYLKKFGLRKPYEFQEGTVIKDMRKPDLEIIDIRPRGYCKGVVNALRIVKKTRLDNPDAEISVLGKIVHNQYITAAFEHYNINTIDKAGLTREELLEFVDHGILILSAHGSSQRIKDIAKTKGLTVIDAVCNDVVSTHEIIREALKFNQQIVYIGKNGHPETEAIIDNFPDTFLITKIADVGKLKLDPTKKILITNQTTLSILEIQEIIHTILDKYPKAEVSNEICGATRIRQQAIIKESNLNALIVVGDPNSNNTAMLAQIGRDQGIEYVTRIETIKDLDLASLQKNWRVGVTSGASTPTYLTEMISDYLKQVNLADPQPKPEIDLSKILD